MAMKLVFHPPTNVLNCFFAVHKTMYQLSTAFHGQITTSFPWSNPPVAGEHCPFLLSHFSPRKRLVKPTWFLTTKQWMFTMFHGMALMLNRELLVGVAYPLIVELFYFKYIYIY